MPRWLVFYLAITTGLAFAEQAPEGERPSDSAWPPSDVTELAAETTIRFHWEPQAKTQFPRLHQMLSESDVEARLRAFVKGSLDIDSGAQLIVYAGSERFFDARSNTSYLPVAFVAQMFSSIQAHYADSGVQQRIFVSAIEQLLWVELGRILVSQLALPMRGDEEVALDTFATLMLVNQYQNDYMLDAVEEYLLVDDASQFFHSGGAQSEEEYDRNRYQLIVCTVLGKDYQPFQERLKSLAWTSERLRQCETRYEQQLVHWYQVLEGHLKEGNKISRWLPAGARLEGTPTSR